jgi:hypothetical protein
MVRCVSKNGHQKEVRSREIGLHAQTMLTILGSIVNINWDRSIWSLNEHKNLHFDNEKDIHMSSENLRGKWLWAWFGYANQFALIACFISYEKWAQGEKCLNNTSLRYTNDKLLKSAKGLKFHNMLTWSYNHDQKGTPEEFCSSTYLTQVQAVDFRTCCSIKDVLISWK